jgi:hypothetical protein
MPCRTSFGNCGGLVPAIISVIWVPSALWGAQPGFTRHSDSLISSRVITGSWLSCCSWLTERLGPGPRPDLFSLQTPSDSNGCKHSLTRNLNFINLPCHTSFGNCGGSLVSIVFSVLWVPSALCGAQPGFTWHLSVSLVSSSRVVSESWLPCCSWLTECLGPLPDLISLQTPSDFNGCKHSSARNLNFMHMPCHTSFGICGGSVPVVTSFLWMPSAFCGARPGFTRHYISLISSRASSDVVRLVVT